MYVCSDKHNTQICRKIHKKKCGLTKNSEHITFVDTVIKYMIIAILMIT